MKKLPFIIGGVFLLLFVTVSSIFIVDERQQALKLRFGQVIGEVGGYRNPGLYFKLPVIDNVVYYEDRILPIETSSLEVTPLDAWDNPYRGQYGEWDYWAWEHFDPALNLTDLGS